MHANYSHKIIVEIGLDVAKYMSPENIVGIKAYLGVDNDLDVLSAIANDKYKDIGTALSSAGFDIIKAGVSKNQPEVEIENNGMEEVVAKDTLNTKEATEDTGSETEEVVEVEHKEDIPNVLENGNTPEEEAVLAKIKSAQKQINDGLIVGVTISEKDYKKGVNSLEMLKKVSGLFDDTKIEFSNFDNEEHKLLVKFMDNMGKYHTIWID